MNFINPLPPVENVLYPVSEERGVNIAFLRTDRIHPGLSGNKWYKLKYNLMAARRGGYNTLLGMGGPWSNHLHALSVAGREFGLNTIGLIRGELVRPLNPCLADAEVNGMQLLGISRKSYADLRADETGFGNFSEQLGRFYAIPEGGSNPEGMQGCAEMLQDLDISGFDLICLACGTGTTLAGLATASSVPLLGFQVLRGKGYLKRNVEQLLLRAGAPAKINWQVNEGYHFGGYARITTPLMRFIQDFQNWTGIPLEPVYSGKMVFGVMDLIKRDFFPQNHSILLIHGGGLQGNRGFANPDKK